jgi:RNase P/RNase MRP subunit p30
MYVIDWLRPSTLTPFPLFTTLCVPFRQACKQHSIEIGRSIISRVQVAAPWSNSSSRSQHDPAREVTLPLCLKQYSRITVRIDDSRHMHDVNTASEILGSYDIVAVRPGSAQVRRFCDCFVHLLCNKCLHLHSLVLPFMTQIFRHVVTSGAVDIISLPAGEKFPFHLKQEHVSLAAEHGTLDGEGVGPKCWGARLMEGMG